jgi:hypothetical protein
MSLMNLPEVRMKALMAVTIASLLLSGTANGAVRSVASEKEKKHAKHGRGDDDRRHRGVTVNVVFSSNDVRVIRTYYAPRYRTLPPGLQKKLARTGQLPPGWRKKMEPFPVAVERELVVLPPGYERGVIDGHAVIYNPRTQVIVDLTVLF